MAFILRVFTHLTRRLHVMVQQNYGKEDFTSAHLFSAWRSEDAGTRAHETSAFIGVKIKMAAVATLCKMCRTYISTNIAMHSQTAKAAAKVGACFTSCLLCIG